MKPTPALCALLAVPALLLGCRTGSHDADNKPLLDNEVQWNADFAAKDAAKVAAHYADDGVLMVPGGPPTSGRDNIAKAFAGMVTDPAFALVLHTNRAVVAESGEIGYTQGSYTLNLTNPVTHQPFQDHGSYVTTYRRTAADGAWKAVEDIATSEVPPPMPSSPPAQ